MSSNELDDRELYIFTISFPFDSSQETNFLLPELKLLSKEYSRIVFVPAQIKGAIGFELASNMSIDTQLAGLLEKKNRIYAFLTWRFWLFFFRICVQISRTKYRSKLSLYFNAVFFSVRMLMSERYMKGIGDTADLFTFWNTYVTASMAYRKGHKGKRWTRVHGDDFYPERQGGVIPFESHTYQNMDKIVFVSKLAEAEWKSRHINLNTKTEVSYIGVSVPIDLEVIPRLPSRKPIILYSCSGLNHVKRIELCNSLVMEWNAFHAENPIEWHHLGASTKEIDKFIGSKSCAIGHEWMSQKEVLEWLSVNQPMAILSVSSSEGFPVSMQEALIMGVPIIASSNGGMIEAVEMSNGFMLPSNPDYKSFEDIILSILSFSDEELLQKRLKALTVGKVYFLR
jgi:glycosyltransferase involved in cell wall biosynthesis